MLGLIAGCMQCSSIFRVKRVDNCDVLYIDIKPDILLGSAFVNRFLR